MLTGGVAQPQARENIISLELPPTIAAKLENAVKQLGYGWNPKKLARLGKPTLKFHQICGANSFINLLYWDEAKTRAPSQPNAIVSLCVRICKETMHEWKERPYVAFLTHSDCPSAWIEEARDCEAVGIMPFMHRPLGPMEEWEEEGLDKIVPFATELVREAKLARQEASLASLDSSAGAAPEATRVVSAPAVPNTGPKVFISYAHSDKEKEWYKALVEFLHPLRSKYRDEFWSDVEIEPGSNWFQTIRDALTSAPIVVFVVSPALLASDFVTRHELTPALTDNKRILWIHGDSALYEDTPFKWIQGAHNIAVDLATASGRKRKEQMAAIAKSISSQLERFVTATGVTGIYRQ